MSGLRLDPLTLRVAAQRLDSAAEARRPHHRDGCRCLICGAVRELCANLAAEFRTQAIQSEMPA